MKKYLIVLVFNFILLDAIPQEMAMMSPGKVSDSNKNFSDTPHKFTQFEFYRVSYEEELNKISEESVNGFFRSDIEKKYQLLNNSYSYDIPLGPGSLSTRTVIEKPVIYSAINKLYKHYRKECKKHELNKKIAEKEYDYVLDVGLSVLFSNTVTFEDAIKSIKDLSELSAFFQSVQLLD